MGSIQIVLTQEQLRKTVLDNLADKTTKSIVQIRLNVSLRRTLSGFFADSTQIQQIILKLPDIDINTITNTSLRDFLERYAMPKITDTKIKSQFESLLLKVPENKTVGDVLQLNISTQNNPIFQDLAKVANAAAILNTSSLDPTLIEKFLAIYQQYDYTSSDALWQAVKADSTVSKSIAELQFTVALANLTQNNTPLVKELQVMHKAGTINTVQDLSSVGSDVWVKMITSASTSNDFQFPSEIPTGTKTSMISSYANLIISKLKQQFPSSQGYLTSANAPLLVDTLPLPTVAKSKFLALLQKYNYQQSSDFWNAVSTDSDLSSHLADLKLMMFLGSVTQNNIQLIKQVQAPSQKVKITKPQDLVSVDWQNIITSGVSSNTIQVPASMPGNTSADKAENYANAIMATIDAAFPTAAFFRDMAASMALGGKLPTLQKVFPSEMLNYLAEFYKRIPDFDFGSMPVTDYLSKNRQETFAQIPQNQRPVFTAMMSLLQRLFYITPDHDEIAALASAGYRSAHDIARTSQANFLAINSEALGGEQRTTAIYNVASYRAAISLATLANYSKRFNNLQVASLATNTIQLSNPTNGANDPDLGHLPDWETLFGKSSLDWTECQDCKSVTSPAAYFANLVTFLESQLAGGNQTALLELFTRRPDLRNIALSCENTETDLPYIDLVDEILENNVVYPSYQSATQSSIDAAPIFMWDQVGNGAKDNMSLVNYFIQNFLCLPQTANQIKILWDLNGDDDDLFKKSFSFVYDGNNVRVVMDRDIQTTQSSPSPNFSVGQKLNLTATAITPTQPITPTGAKTKLTVTITDTSGTPTTPTGTVTMDDGGAGGTFDQTPPLYSLTAGKCTVTYTPPANPPGSILISATYSGDTGHASSSSLQGLAVGSLRALASLTPAITNIVFPSGSKQITINWVVPNPTPQQLGGGQIMGVLIERSDDGKNFAPLKSLYGSSLNPPAFNDTYNIDSNKTYWYRISSIIGYLQTTTARATVDNTVNDTYAWNQQSCDFIILQSQDNNTPPNVTYKVYPLIQTDGISPELLANPQHTNVQAYETLRTNDETTSLPFDLWIEQARAYLAQLGTSLYEVMSTFRSNGILLRVTKPSTSISIPFSAPSASPPSPTTTVIKAKSPTLQSGIPTGLSITIKDNSSTPTPPGGKVTMDDGGAGGTFDQTSYTVGASGTCTVNYTPPSSLPDRISITAIYGGDNNHYGSSGWLLLSSSSSSLDPTTINILPNPLTIQSVTNVQLAITVTDTSSSPSITAGIITMDDAGAGGKFDKSFYVLDSNGKCTVTYTPATSPPKNVKIKTIYWGDSGHYGSSCSLSLSSSPVNPTTITITPDSPTVQSGIPIGLAIAVTNASGSPSVPKGTIILFDWIGGNFGKQPCTLDPTGKCNVVYTPPPNPSKNMSITALYFAADASHSNSSASISLQGLPLDPAHPTGLVAAQTDNNAIALSWNPLIPKNKYLRVIAYAIERSDGSGWETIYNHYVEDNPSPLTYIDGSVEGNLPSYRVSAILGDVKSSPEYFGITYAEAGILYNEDDAGSLPPGNTMPVQDLLDLTGLAYADLVALLETSFINPNETVQITIDPSDANNISSMNVVGLDTIHSDKIPRFVRLWRKLGWQMQDLDTVITSLNASDIDDALLTNLAVIGQIQSRLQISLASVAALLSTINTQGDNSLYDQIFQSATILNPPDTMFALDDTGEALAVESLPKPEPLSNHYPVIFAALGITSTDLAAMTTVNNIDDSVIQSIKVTDNVLTLANLSKLYRIATLSQSLNLSASDLFSLIQITGINPFDQVNVSGSMRYVANIQRFITAAQQVLASSFSIDQLNYIIRDQYDASNGIKPSESDVSQFFLDMVTKMQKVRQQTSTISDPKGDLLRQNLPLVLTPDKSPDFKDSVKVDTWVEKFISIVKGTSTGGNSTSEQYVRRLFDWIYDDTDADDAIRILSQPPAPSGLSVKLSSTPLASTSVALVAPTPTIQPGTAVKLAVTVTDTSSSPTALTGTITMSDAGAGGTFDQTTYMVDAAGKCTVNYTPPANPPNAITISAAYANDPSHSNSSASLSLSSPPLASTSVALVAPTPTIQPGTAVKLAVTVTDTSSSPTALTGTITMSDAGAGGTFDQTPPKYNLTAGKCTVNYTPPANPPNAITISAAYADDPSHSNSSASLSSAVLAVNLTWINPDIAPSSSIVGYIVERSSDSGNTWSVLNPPISSVAPLYSDTSLAPNTQYNYRIRSVDAASNASSAFPQNVSPSGVVKTPPIGAPSMPRSLSVSLVLVQETGNSPIGVQLNWDEPNVTPYPIVGYQIQRSDGSGIFKTIVSNTGQLNTTYLDNPGTLNSPNSWLSPSTKYTYQVAAIAGPSGNVVGDFSTTMSVITPPDGCASQPVNLKVQASPTEIDLSWSAPALSGILSTQPSKILPIVGYRIERSPDGGKTWPTSYLVPYSGSTICAYVDKSALFDENYAYRVTPVTLSVPVLSQSNLTGNPQYTLNWKQPSSLGSNLVVGYVVQRSSDKGNTWSTLIANTGSITTYADTEVDSTQTYSYQVSALVLGSPSDPITPTVPDPVTIADKFSYVTSRVMMYLLSKNVVEQAFAVFMNLPTDTSSTLLAENLLSSSTEGQENSQIVSMQYFLSNSFVNASCPDAMSSSNFPIQFGLFYSIYKASLLIDNFKISVDDLNHISSHASKFGRFTLQFFSKLNPNASSFGFTQLESLYNVFNLGAKLGGDVPLFSFFNETYATTNLKASLADSGTEIDLNWNAPAVDFDDQFEGYDIQRSNDSGSTWLSIGQTQADATTYQDKGLIAGEQYVYRVSTIFSNNEGVPSAVSDPITIPSDSQTPAPPTDLTPFIVSSTEIDLNWTPPKATGVDNNCAQLGIESYQFERWDDCGSSWIDVTSKITSGASSCKDTTVSPNTTYIYRMYTINNSKGGMGGKTSAVSKLSPPITIPDSVTPSPPKSLNATMQPTVGVALQWLQPACTGGSVIASYVIEASVDFGSTWDMVVNMVVSKPGSTAMTYLDTGNNSKNNVLYRVSATNTAGNTGEPAVIRTVDTSGNPIKTFDADSSGISNLTGWNLTDADLLVNDYFELPYPNDFRNASELARLKTCFDLGGKVGASIKQLFSWATQITSPGIATEIKNVLRSKYSSADQWNAVAAQIENKLRDKKEAALVSYLVYKMSKLDLQPPISTADDLFNYFLIDVQMSSCRTTSRISQAIQSIQLFIQRILLGLEQEGNGLAPSIIPQDLWSWMQSYTTWQANRMVFLYPENYIDPQLRTDATPFFNDFKNEISQNSITEDTAETAYINYLTKLEGVAHLIPSGMYDDTANTGLIHVFARTFSVPTVYYYRTCNMLNSPPSWSAWEKVDVNIGSDYVMPAIVNNRLYIFWPIFSENSSQNNDTNLNPNSGSPPQKYYDIGMEWSQYKNGKWSSKQKSTSILGSSPGIPQNSPVQAGWLEYIPGVTHYWFPVYQCLFEVWKLDGQLVLSMFNTYETDQMQLLDNFYFDDTRGEIVSAVSRWENQGKSDPVFGFNGNFQWIDALHLGQNTIGLSPPAMGPNTTNNAPVNDGEFISPSARQLDPTTIQIRLSSVDMVGGFLTLWIGVIDPINGANVPTGTVTLSDGGANGSFNKTAPINSGLDSNGSCTYTYSINLSKLQSAGSVTITVVYNGDFAHAGSSGSSTLSFTASSFIISKYLPATEIIITPNMPSIISTGATVSLNVTVFETSPSPGSLSPVSPSPINTSDSIRMDDGGAGGTFDQILPFYKLSSGACTVKYTPPAGSLGPITITASYGGSMAYGASSASVSFTESSLYLQNLPVVRIDNSSSILLPDNANDFDTFPVTPWGTLLGISYITVPYGITKVLSSGNSVWGSSFMYRDSKRTFFVYPASIQIRPFTDVNFTFFGQSASGIMLNLPAFNFVTFYHSYVPQFILDLEEALRNNEGILGFLSLKNQAFGLPAYATSAYNSYKSILLQGSDFESFYTPLKSYLGVLLEPDESTVDFTPSPYGPYSEYNWELFFHLPFLIAAQLSADQQFSPAMKWFNSIFNPSGQVIDPNNGNPATSPQCYWNFLPFFLDEENQAIQNVQDLFDASPSTLTGQQNVSKLDAQITTWMKNPFNPFSIASARPGTFEKTVVMKYIDNLISWGDQLFGQFTSESVNQATELYVIANQILGPEPPDIPPSGITSIQTWQTLDLISQAYGSAPGQQYYNLWNNFAETYVQMENQHPFTPASAAGSSGVVSTGLPDLLNVVAMPYFCIPSNANLISYWSKVQTRLDDIRHCKNLQGQSAQPSLYPPTVNPMSIVEAVAGGSSISSAVNSLNSPLPYYRFTFMLQKAVEVCNDVKSLGAALLSALEKKDAEALAMIRATREANVQNYMLKSKQSQIQEATDNITALKASLKLAQDKLSYYQSRLFMSPGETLHLTLLTSAWQLQSISQMAQIEATLMRLIPDFEFGVSGIASPVATFKFGGTALGDILGAYSSAMSFQASFFTHQGEMVSTLAGYGRRWDDWQFQVTQANDEIVQINDQITAASDRLQTALDDFATQTAQVQNANYVQNWMQNKFTNEDLYAWMKLQISSVYFDSYQMAYDLAKKAEVAYRFETGDTATFIQFGYWDNLKQGLLAGENLNYDLKRIEKAYVDQNQRRFEITKSISLALINPQALLDFIEKGSCNFELPEMLFDMDFPGHYMRRIKSVTITIPCVVGPYTSINAVLTLLNSKIRTSPNVVGSADKFYDDANFTSILSSVQSIATSHGQNDSGMFELNFHDERYLPFEGAGVYSQWALEMPQENFDFNTISDVVIKVSYTAWDGGSGLRTAAKAAYDARLAKVSSSGLMRLFSAKHEFPNEWQSFLNPQGGTSSMSFKTNLTRRHFPFQLDFNSIKINAIKLVFQMKKDSFFASSYSGTLPISVNETHDSLAFDDSDFMVDNVMYLEMPIKLVPSKNGAIDIELSLKNAPSWMWKLDGSGNSVLNSEVFKDMAIICYYTATPKDMTKFFGS